MTSDIAVPLAPDARYGFELRARAATAMLELAFNPHQRRDSKGRWTKMPDSELKRPRRAMRQAARGQLAAWAALPNGDMNSEAAAQLERFFAIDDPATGFRTELIRGYVQHFPEAPTQVSASLHIRDREGNRVGTATRIFGEDPATGKRWVEHSSFTLNPDAQSGGFSSRWLAQMEDRYRAAGVDHIKINATRVGGYAWAKAGFDFADAGTAWSHVGLIRGKLMQRNQLTPELDRQLADMMKRATSGNDEERPTPMEMAMLGWTPGATTWPGKEMMLNTYWEGVKQL